MHGPLHEIGLIEVLQLLQRGARCGVLRVTASADSVSHRIVLRDGMVTDIEPDAGDSSVVGALIARHLVLPGAVEGAEARRRILESPLARGVRADLASRALRTMLHWREGRFDFVAQAPGGGGHFALSPDSLVFDMVAAESRRYELARATADFRAVAAFAPLARLAAAAPMALSPRQWQVLDQVDGVRSVSSIAAALDLPVEEIAADIRMLEAVTILELQPVAAPPEPTGGPTDTDRYGERALQWRARVTECPEDADAWRALGLMEIGAGRFERALAVWQEWAAVDPTRAAQVADLMQAARTMVEALRESRD